MAQQVLTLKQIGTSNDILIGEDEIVSYVQKVAPKATGTQDSVVVSELNDSTATFITAKVSTGDVVTDTTGFISARVVSVDSETALTLDADIFTASEAYEVGASYDLEYDGDAVAAFLKAGDALVSVADNATLTELFLLCLMALELRSTTDLRMFSQDLFQLLTQQLLLLQL
jgi:hypothetical protein